MANKDVYVTEQGLAEMKEELDYLVNEKRPEVIQALKEARALGDLSENAEYDAARNDQAVTENRIKELEVLIEKAKIINNESSDQVTIGSTVKIEYVGEDDTDTYSIVGSTESDPFANKISNESPIAKALLGAKVGDIVSVESPNGKYDIKVIELN